MGSATKYKIILLMFFLFMFLGNILRLIPLATALGSFNLFELVLYASCLLLLFFSWKDIRKFPGLFILIYSLFFVSYLIGALRVQEVSTLAFTYNIRIFLLFITSYVIGLSFFRIYGSNLQKVINFYIVVFVVNTIVAWVIYFIFPDASQLYAFLSLFGVIYHGDPHLHRLLGTLFDPNFFGNLLILPILMSLYLFDLTRKKKYIAVFIFLLFSEFFTFSRSSLLGLSLGLMFYYLSDIKTFINNCRIKKSLFINTVILAASIVSIFYLFPDEIIRITERFTSMRQDESAAHRYNNFMLAINLLSQIDVLIFGIGFNFFSYLGLTKLSSIDSSVLALMVTLGIPIFTITAVTMIHLIRSSLWGYVEENLFVKKVYLNYLIVSVLLSSFNNLLLFPFWFFCMFSLLCYFRLNRTKRY